MLLEFYIIMTEMTTGKKVLVTGANGHLGYTLVKTLSERGYQVRASVRDYTNNEKTEHLKLLGQKVEIVSLDITDLEQFKQVSSGMDTIFHAAAVFKFGLKNPEETIIKPIVEGALNALRAAQANGITKIIYTSSAVTLGGNGIEGKPRNENDWDAETKVPYQLAKVKAEQQAWELADELGVKMIAVLPGLILGPYFKNISSSIHLIEQMAEGKVPLIPPFGFNITDVREVTEAHIQAYEKFNTEGRYIVGHTEPTSFEEILRILNKEDPSIKVPRGRMTKGMFVMYARVTSFFARLFGKVPQITTQQAKEYSKGRWMDISKAQNELGITPRPIEESVIDTLNWLRKPKFKELEVNTGKSVD